MSSSFKALEGLLAPNGVIFTATDKIFHIGSDYTVLLGGFGLILTAILNPEGIAGAWRLLGDRIRQVIAARRTEPRTATPKAVPVGARGGS